eukprot:2337971-Rhodomonas_salina.2
MRPDPDRDTLDGAAGMTDTYLSFFPTRSKFRLTETRYDAETVACQLALYRPSELAPRLTTVAGTLRARFVAGDVVESLAANTKSEPPSMILLPKRSRAWMRKKDDKPAVASPCNTMLLEAGETTDAETANVDGVDHTTSLPKETSTEYDPATVALIAVVWKRPLLRGRKVTSRNCAIFAAKGKNETVIVGVRGTCVM